MKYLILLFLISAFFISKTLAQSEVDVVLKGISLLPGDYAKAIDEYRKILGLGAYEGSGVGGSNAGISSYNSTFLRNSSCFHELGKQFYQSIKDQDKKIGVNEHFANSRVRKPNLSISCNDDMYCGLSDGWLWQKALEFAEGNEFLAQKLIFVCGHDDIAQIDYVEGFYCPGSKSTMFAPGSLSIDISNSLKEKIETIQAPHLGKAALPSKYYHILASAGMVCELIRNGVSPNKARTLQVYAASGYRRFRLSKTAKDHSSKYKALQYLYDRSGKKHKDLFAFNNRTKLISTIKNLINEYYNQSNIAEKKKIERLGIDTSYFFLFLDSIEKSKNSEIDFNNAIGKFVDRVNGLELYRRSNVNFAGHTIPFSWGGLKSKAQEVIWNYDDPERYQGAYKKLETFEMDVEWTSTQHEKGATFGVEKCSKGKKLTDIDLNNLACISLVNKGLCEFDNECKANTEDEKCSRR